jgi:hypothetical protein
MLKVLIVLTLLFSPCLFQGLPNSNFGMYWSDGSPGSSGCRWMNFFTNGVVSGYVDSRVTNSYAIQNFTYSCNGTHLVAYQELNPYTNTFFTNYMNESADNAQLVVYGNDGCLLINVYCGFQDAAQTIRVNQNTLFTGYSVSKAIYMILLGIAEMDDYFDWDDNMMNLMPGFQMNVTVEQLFSDSAPGSQAFNGYYSVSDITLGSYNHTKMRNLVNTASLIAPVNSLNGYNTVNHGVYADELLIQLTGMNISTYTDQVIDNIIGTNFYFGLYPTQTEQLSKLAFITQGSTPQRGSFVYDLFLCQTVNCTLLAQGDYVFLTNTIQGRSISPCIGLNNFISNYMADIYTPSAG